MPLSAYGQKAALDWLLGGASVTRPSGRWLGLATGAPTSVSASECTGATATRYTRATVVFTAAHTTGQSVTNASICSFQSFSVNATLTGFQIWDTQPVGSGNMLWYGNLSANTLPTSNSAFTFGIGSILLTIK